MPSMPGSGTVVPPVVDDVVPPVVDDVVVPPVVVELELELPHMPAPAE